MPRAKRTISLCFLHTLPGLEKVAWLEVRRRLPTAQFKADAYARNQYGMVLFTLAEPVERLHDLRMATAVFLGVLWEPNLSRGHQDLRRLEEDLQKRGDLGRAVNQFTRTQQRQMSSYHVRAEKYGQHQYRLRDWSRMVRQVVSRLYPEWTGRQEGADVEIRATLFGSQALIGVHLPRPEGQETDSPAAAYPAALAAGLVELTEPAANDLFLDPLAADEGLVLQERRAAGEAAVLWAGRGLTAEADSPADGAEEGADTVQVWAEGQLPVAARTVDKIATIVPAGLAEGTVLTLLRETARVLQPAGRCALFTHEYDRLLNLMREVPGLAVSGGYSVLAAGKWGRIYVIEPTNE